MNAEELTLDAAELQSLLRVSKRPNIQGWIKSKIEETERELKKLSDSQTSNSEPTGSAPKPVNAEKSSPSSLPTVKVTNYGWDESDKFVKVYITLKGVQDVNPTTIHHSFYNYGYDITVSNFSGKNYTMTMKGLRDEIVPESCQIKYCTPSYAQCAKTPLLYR
ncbi:unnamed protein product [Cylicostephanus goldi]|uniref:CS domain-containing protein n=1 Tax=Cylicostephanus goldi TaxID=71465 RepID=A0A3P7MGX1_CYLGO|nr:unnamed protein product [Cylicostephanus goldi]